MGEMKEKPFKKERERLQVVIPKPDNKSMQTDGTWVSIDYGCKIRKTEVLKDVARLDEAKKEKARILGKEK